MPARSRSRGNGRQGLPRATKGGQGMIPVLTHAVRGLESAVQRGRVTISVRETFQAVALLVRDERQRAKAQAPDDLKRVDGIATVLARAAARDHSLLTLLSDEAPLLSGTRQLMREMAIKAGVEPPVEPPVQEAAEAPQERRVVPRSVIARQLSNPFLEPDYSAAPAPKARPRLLVGWELLEPLLRSFEEASPGAPSSMRLPNAGSLGAAGGRELMPHQAQVIEAASDGHRTFLLADEPGLGKTAQALLAAQAADAFPLLVVVPNVVKTNWAREAGIWTPSHPATVVHSDGETIDAFADIVVVNYELLDRHVGWLGKLGFRGMVVDEAHFIKNKTSKRSRHVLEVSKQIRERTPRPLLMALTGTPLINDIEDFLAIWEFLGWIDAKAPQASLMHELEDNGFTPADREFYPAARQSVVELGIVRRRKVDVAADIPARRIADLPVELEGALGRSIRDAEQVLARRLVKRYESALAARDPGVEVHGIDHALVRQIAAWERRDADEAGTGENVFSMLRRIGQAKAELAADYAAQLSHNVGKVVFFAKHISVMDTAEQVFTKRGIGHVSVRGEQTGKVRQASVDAFVNDPDVAIAVCSLTAAGVGLNLQVASNLVLAELSWTDAEQTQAIDRVHRIGQDQPVTAWRVIAAQTMDARIAELIDSKAGLAGRALDGQDVEITSADIQLEALVALLTEALEDR